MRTQNINIPNAKLESFPIQKAYNGKNGEKPYNKTKLTKIHEGTFFFFNKTIT